MFDKSEPVVETRGIQLDFKGVPPTFDRLERLVELFAELRFNTVMVEWEDMFPWEFEPRLRGQGHYTSKQVDRFYQRCEAVGLEVIPLVQCLGHMESLLKIDDYAQLRELPNRVDCLHPLHADAGQIAATLIEEMVDRSPGLRYLHLGGDEAWDLGRHPESQRFVENHGAAELYLQHVEPLLEMLNVRGIRPILWHDMMMEWSDQDLGRIGKQADLMVWGYRGTPEQNRHHHSTEVLDRMRAQGVGMWGSSAYKGCDGTHRDVPDLPARVENNLGWAGAALPYELKGVVVTGWSRYWTSHIQVEPIDAALPVLVQVATALHDGVVPDDAAKQVEDLLCSWGEWDTVAPLRQSMENFQQACGVCWLLLRQGEEFMAGFEVDSSRVEGESGTRIFEALEIEIEILDRAAAEIPERLRGLVIQHWADQYALPRVVAIRNALASLIARFTQRHNMQPVAVLSGS